MRIFVKIKTLFQDIVVNRNQKKLFFGRAVVTKKRSYHAQ